MVTLRLLVAMTLGALVAALGALFLGEYEFDEWLPIAAGPLLGLIVAEIVVSLGKHRSATMAGILAVWSATAIVLAGYLDTNVNEPIKTGAYVSAALAAVAAAVRTNDWRGTYRARSATSEQENSSTTATRPSSSEAPSGS